LSIGDGDLRSYYENKYSKLTNLTFAPKVQKQMVQSVLSKCDLLYFSVHKSKVWQYGQSLNKIIDYMISGKPVVASFSGYPSMINEANSGSYVPAGDLEALKKEIQKYSTLSNEELSIIGNIKD
jgi:glycosyltransferase involved in cell wall biosynthesis